MKTLILTTTAAVAFLLTNAGSAEAGPYGVAFGNGGYSQGGFNGGYNGGFGGYNGGHLHHNVNPNFNPYPINGHYDWHDTTHLDYIPGQWVQHGCHWDYIPGRTVLHQDGHWDLHHH